MSLSITLSNAIEQDPENLFCTNCSMWGKTKKLYKQELDTSEPFRVCGNRMGAIQEEYFWRKNLNPDPGPTESFFSDLLKKNYGLLL